MFFGGYGFFQSNLKDCKILHEGGLGMGRIADKKPFDFQPYGKAIKRARNDRKWNRDKLSEEVGISTTYLTEIENKGQCPSFPKIVSIVKTLGISLDEIIYKDSFEKRLSKTTTRFEIENLMDKMSEYDLNLLKAGLIVGERIGVIKEQENK